MESPNKRQISPERKLAYYAGMVLAVIGILLFLSNFVFAIANFGDFHDFAGRGQSMMVRAFGGMALTALGGVIAGIAARGLAGSGVLLDPERARKDVEPWSRMAGGVVQDALSEVKIVNKLEDRLESPEPQIKIRCRNCQALNDETAKFCNQCGATV